jgi:hypothetical protein
MREHEENEREEHLKISDIVHEEKKSREALTSKWLDLWSLYKTRPINVRSDDGWQSKINDGRTFELVETVASYIRNAMFFSDRWVSLESNEPDLAEILPLVNTYFVDVLNNSNFKREFRVFLTQLLLTGFSGILPYWDTDNDCLAFETINSYDLFIESSRRYSDRFSYSFRRIELNYAEFCCWVDDGLLEIEGTHEEAWQELASDNTERTAELYNLRDTIPVNDKDSIVVIEYYCPKERELYRFVGDRCLYDEEVDKCPWLVGLLFETPEDSYALSLIDSSIGLVIANNILHNRRLDNIDLSIDNMWLLVDDGVVNPAEIKSEPGKVIVVAKPDTLTPLQPPANNFNVTYQEQQVLDAKIDRNVGTGAMISANAYRKGERVTAEEIKSVKDAGGNRLTDVFEHIESTVIIPLLKRAFELVKEHTRKSKVVKLPSDRPNVYDYFKMLPSDLNHDYTIKVVGTQSVINRDRNISLISEFVTLVSGIPQFVQLVDWTNLFTDLVVKFGFDDPARYILKQQPQEEQATTEAPQSPLQQMAQQAGDIGGAPMQAALQEQVLSGQAPNLAANFSGLSPETVANSSDQEQAAATAFMSTPQM